MQWWASTWTRRRRLAIHEKVILRSKVKPAIIEIWKSITISTSLKVWVTEQNRKWEICAFLRAILNVRMISPSNFHLMCLGEGTFNSSKEKDLRDVSMLLMINWHEKLSWRSACRRKGGPPEEGRRGRGWRPRGTVRGSPRCWTKDPAGTLPVAPDTCPPAKRQHSTQSGLRLGKSLKGTAETRQSKEKSSKPIVKSHAYQKCLDTEG